MFYFLLSNAIQTLRNANITGFNLIKKNTFNLEDKVEEFKISNFLPPPPLSVDRQVRDPPEA